MDLQLILAVNIMTISALVIGSIVVYRTRDGLGWAAVNMLVLAVGGLALWVAPLSAGNWVVAFFVPLVLGPAALARLAQRRAQAGSSSEAARYAWWAALLHPSSANRMTARLMAAVAASTETDTQALKDLVANAPPEYRPIAQAQLALARRDWPAILGIARAQDMTTPTMKSLEIRALGETGRVDDMIRCYHAAAEMLSGADAAVTRLIVLAFGGRPDAVACLLEAPLRQMNDETKHYWMAVGYLHSVDNRDLGIRALQSLSTGAALPATRAAAQRRLDAANAAAPMFLSAMAKNALDTLADKVCHAAAVRAQSFRGYPITVALIGLNFLAFGAEVLAGGSEDSETLIGLGALWPPLVLMGGEWWRLLSASFLHFGPIHLFSNMFVLWILGRALEPQLGPFCTTTIYIFGGIASSAFVLWLMWSEYSSYGLLVGASGAIFALLGAETALVILAWVRDPKTFDRRKLSMLGMMLALQVGIDLSVPNVSFAAHASGFAAGLLTMLAWTQVARVSRNYSSSDGTPT